MFMAYCMRLSTTWPNKSPPTRSGDTTPTPGQTASPSSWWSVSEAAQKIRQRCSVSISEMQNIPRSSRASLKNM